MCVSTSLVNASVRFVIVAGLACGSVIAAKADATTRSKPSALIPTSAQVSAALNALPSAFAHKYDLPEGAPILKPSRKFLRWNSTLPNKNLLVLINIRFAGTTNSYCRLVTLSPELTEPILVKVPPQANYDDCASMSEPIYADLNADGIDDVAFSVEVSSNRYTTNATAPVVYLSNSTNSVALMQRIQRETERLGRDIAQCDSH